MYHVYAQVLFTASDGNWVMKRKDEKLACFLFRAFRSLWSSSWSASSQMGFLWVMHVFHFAQFLPTSADCVSRRACKRRNTVVYMTLYLFFIIPRDFPSPQFRDCFFLCKRFEVQKKVFSIWRLTKVDWTSFLRYKIINGFLGTSEYFAFCFKDKDLQSSCSIEGSDRYELFSSSFVSVPFISRCVN